MKDVLTFLHILCPLSFVCRCPNLLTEQLMQYSQSLALRAIHWPPKRKIDSIYIGYIHYCKGSKSIKPELISSLARILLYQTLFFDFFCKIQLIIPNNQIFCRSPLLSMNPSSLLVRIFFSFGKPYPHLVRTSFLDAPHRFQNKNS